VTVVVIGAGASGLSFGLFWGADVRIFESEDTAGGHARSISKGGFLWDRGPHMMFSRDKAVLKFMVDSLGDNVHQCRRNNVVKVAGSTLQYPLENDLGALPRELATTCVADFVDARLALPTAAEPRNLQEWFLTRFGAGLTELYFQPYNEKVWNVPLSRLSMLWSERIPNPPVRDVVIGAMGQATEGYTHQLFYNYPLQGGFGALMQAWADRLPAGALELGSSVERLFPEGRGVRLVLADGREDFAEAVVSTMPLDVLCRVTHDCPDEIVSLVNSLIVNPMIIANFGFKGDDQHQYTAAYVPDEEYFVNRVSYPAVYSPRNAPVGHYLVQAEVTCAPESPVMEWSDAQVVDHVLPGLVARGLAPESKPVLTSIERYDRAYIVYDTGYEQRLAPVLEWFRARGIWPHGRFGSHNYLNVDGCVRQSADLSALLGRPVTDEQIGSYFSI
jgi:protoporphyrinogen oxidase